MLGVLRPKSNAPGSPDAIRKTLIPYIAYIALQQRYTVHIMEPLSLEA